MLDSIRGLSVAGGGTPVSPAAPTAEAAPETLPIALKSVLDRLPAVLKPLATRAANPDEKINVPTAKVLAQLATGAVRVTFDELRAAAPADLFSAGGSGEVLVDLPLPEVLRVAGPWLKRKSAPKAEPAAGSFFTGLGPVSAPAPPPAPAPVAAPAPAAFAPVAFAPAFQPAPEMPKGGTTFTSFQPTPEPAAPAPALFSPAPAAPEEPTANVVPIKLAVLTVGWPDNVRKEAADLGDVTVEFPREQLGNAMKSGKVSFTWGQLRSWMKPAVGPSVADSTALPLPLRVLVQPFMSNMRSGAKAPGAGDANANTFLNRVPSPSLTVPLAHRPRRPARPVRAR